MNSSDHLLWVHPLSARVSLSDDAESEADPGGWTLHLPEGRHSIQFPVQTPSVIEGKSPLYLHAVRVLVRDVPGKKMQESAKVWVYDNDILIAVEEKAIPKTEWWRELTLALEKPYQVRWALCVGIGLGAGHCVVGPASCRLST